MAKKMTPPAPKKPDPPKFETVSYRYDFKSRNNLKRGTK